MDIILIQVLKDFGIEARVVAAHVGPAVTQYEFEIKGLTKFNPTLRIPKKEFNFKNINSNSAQNMVFNIGLAEFGFSSVGAFIVYMLGNILLMISYWTIWVLYFKKKAYWKQIALALIPTCIFLLSGITMLHFLLIIFAVIFGIGHLYVTNKNRVD